ncbi:HNH endonuclease [Carboxylicivirga caseinilyticus]|uniref:HNH endonuclease n=1 Tax=Carboxylicivirga caseinilyticus TaxID=3417572 RepID=UPI003D3308A4|nr:HNH endonuclease [Marinilabiliaceae bacterium A049]
MIWRWDQGRLLYFQFDVLKNMAEVLSELSGTSMLAGTDILRNALEDKTNLPFAPSNYTVWRNYKRVFECSFLATKIDGKLQATDFCLEICRQDGSINDVDDYFSLYIPRFRFPFPAFQDYNPKDNVIHPFCAILKFLASRIELGDEPKITIEEVFGIIIANNCTGFETIEDYKKLLPIPYTIKGDQKRQVREMLIFISQMSILKWFNNSLYLDIDNDEINSPEFRKLITPKLLLPNKLKEEDFLKLTKTSDGIILPTKIRSRESASDELFIEGKKSRVTHLKIERSPLLRKVFLQNNPEPVCHMCETNMSLRYPWTKYLIEMHHILPLSSTIAISTKGTSMDDLIGLCPSCHKSVHLFYKTWLDAESIDDFRSKNEAKDVYLQAKRKLVI